MEKLPEEFNLRELMSKSTEKTPYNVIAIQECERMTHLIREIRRSLKELSLGLKVNPAQDISLIYILKIFLNETFSKPRVN